MSLFKEFRDFAIRGNVVDLAVGVIIGAAFSNIVSSLVANIIMPPLGLLIGGVDFRQFSWILKPAKATLPKVAIEYGAFLQTVFDFVIISFMVFLVIKIMNKLYQKKEKKPIPSSEEILLSEIRDLLKEQNKKYYKTSLPVKLKK